MATPRTTAAVLALAAQLVAAGSVAEPGTAPSSSSSAGAGSAGRLNVFFMIVDDMRPSLGAYNVTMPGSNAMAHTPNIDKLASESLTFKRVRLLRCSAFRAAAFCSAAPPSAPPHVAAVPDAAAVRSAGLRPVRLLRPVPQLVPLRTPSRHR